MTGAVLQPAPPEQLYAAIGRDGATAFASDASAVEFMIMRPDGKVKLLLDPNLDDALALSMLTPSDDISAPGTLILIVDTFDMTLKFRE